MCDSITRTVGASHSACSKAGRLPRLHATTLPKTTTNTQKAQTKLRTTRHTQLTSLVGQEAPLTTSTNTQEATKQQPFEWTKWWYAAHLLEDLEPNRPTPVKLLGRDFVLWRDVNKEWKCFVDACPHRLAPLSEGRIEPSDGSLMCSYHGWRFQSDGECTRIPQAKDGGASVGCKNPRSRVQAYPVMVCVPPRHPSLKHQYCSMLLAATDSLMFFLFCFFCALC